jgi:DNA primase
VGDYTNLKKAGASWKGLSPFTTEKTPSFHVHPEKGLFYCFSTSQGGDVFRFLMLKEGLNFQESVERVASRFGVVLQYEKGGGSQDERTLRARLLALHDVAAAHFAAAFKADNEAARAVRDYWTQSRRFSLGTAEQFQIGFAPVDGGGLARALLKAGFPGDVLRKSGLFVGTDYSPDPLRWRARFRGRLMIPIRDIQGRVVAFTARQLDLTPKDDPSHEAKYVNSPETEIFRKSLMLFNLDKARVSAREGVPFVLVEGQLDAIRAYTCGVLTVVASQGTAIGAEHVTLLRRYTNRVDALLDADRAGQAAVLRLLPLAFQSGLDLRVLHVPGGKDPDEYLAAHGADGWPAVRDHAVGAIAFAVRALIPPGVPLTTVQKLEALQTLFAIIAQSASAVVRDETLGEVCRLTSLDPHAVRSDFLRYQQKQRHRPANAAAPAADPATDAPAAPLATAEEALLALLLKPGAEGFAREVAAVVQHEWLDTSTVTGRLLGRVLAEIAYGDCQTPAHTLAETQEEVNLFSQLSLSPIRINDARAQASECVAALFNRFVRRRRAEIARKIAALPPAESPEKTRVLQEEEIRLRKALQTPPRIVWAH